MRLVAGTYMYVEHRASIGLVGLLRCLWYNSPARGRWLHSNRIVMTQSYKRIKNSSRDPSMECQVEHQGVE